MRRFLGVFHRVAAPAGVLGAMIGFSHWSPAWPRVSALFVLRCAIIGWLAGVLLSAIATVIVARQDGGERAKRPTRLRLLFGGIVGLIAYLPPMLWVGASLSRPVGQRAVAAGSGARPNIILITIDALRATSLGAYGARTGLTPSLDGFAAEATRYDSAYASSPWTLTSATAIFSGLPPSECGLKPITRPTNNWFWYLSWAHVPEGVPLFHEELRRSGYTTAAELTNCFLSAERGWQRGFDDFRNEDGPEIGSVLTHANTVTQRTTEWLFLNRQRPFFLWVHYLDPHAPYDPPDVPRELRARYPSEWVARRQFYYEQIRGADAQTQRRYEAFCREMYAEEVRYTDRWVGRLLQAIKEAGMWDSSLIVITSDHGEELFEHGLFEHGHSLHEEVLRVPLLVKWPAGMAADGAVKQTVGLADLGPTFLEAAGVSKPESMKPNPLPRREGARGDEVYAEGILHGTEQTALITDGFKAILRPGGRSGGRVFEIYDRRSDRLEREPLPASDATQAIRQRLLLRTQQAEAAAKRWEARARKTSPGRDLSRASREQLRALGYL